VAQVLPSGTNPRALIEVDELRTEADRLGAAEPSLEASEALRDQAATLAAVRLARPLLKRGVDVILLDYLACRFASVYRRELAQIAPVAIVRLDTDSLTHRARNRCRPAIRRYPDEILDLLRASARQEGRPDFSIDTTGKPADQTARQLDALLRS
jgi:hypothetical protein